jgi:hypothetical protein
LPFLLYFLIPVTQRYKERNIQQYVEDEELIQGKFSGTVQREKFDKDELLQGKFDTAQREEIDEEELLQGKVATSTAQLEEIPSEGGEANLTGMPDNLKSGIESLSGYSMDDVKVHYNSPKPAQLQALAYAQGDNIHIAPGQEKHLPHEAWHVVQQKQGRVQSTMQLQGVNVNDNEELEREADVMGKLSRYSSGREDFDVKQGNNMSIVIQMNKFDEFHQKEYGEKPLKKKEIPRVIHRFWAGGPIHPSDFENIFQMQNRLNERNKNMYFFQTKWKQILWTSGSFNKEKSSTILSIQLEKLKNNGVEIIDYELKFGKITLDNIKHISDQVRLKALLEYGGTYMDMDIGPGNETFENDIYHRTEDGAKGWLPLIGSAFAFDNKEHSLNDEKQSINKKGYAWNYFFSSAKGNPFIAKMLERSKEGVDAQSIMVEMFQSKDLFRDAFTPMDLKFSTRGSIEKKESKDMETENTFRYNYQRYSYNLEATPSDGNCFFNAISIYLKNNYSVGISPNLIRKEAFAQSPIPLPQNFKDANTWVDDRIGNGAVIFLGQIGIHVTLNIHYLMNDGSYFDTISYGTGNKQIHLVMKDGTPHFTFANIIKPERRASF